LKWLDYGARIYLSDLGRWNGVDRMAEKYLPLPSYAFTLNNPIMLVDPNGMEVTAVDGGYRYTGSDAASAFNFLTSNKKNVYIALIENTTMRENTNKHQYGDVWSVFAAASADEALTMTSFIKQGSLDNLVYEAHGGIIGRANKNFLKTNLKERDNETGHIL
jgi:hypothetical protein